MLGLVFYETERGNSPVGNYVDEQDATTRALLLEKLGAFREEFPSVRTVSIKQLLGKVWEIRVHDARGRQHRLLYAVLGKDLVVLHAFVKKVQRTPREDIALAQHRLKEMME